MAAFQGKAVLVLGGSRGIGAAIVRRFAAEGAAVTFTYAGSREAAERLGGRGGAPAGGAGGAAGGRDRRRGGVDGQRRPRCGDRAGPRERAARRAGGECRRWRLR